MSQKIYIDRTKLEGVDTPSVGQTRNIVIGDDRKLKSEAKPSIPTKTSDLTNDSDFITINDIPLELDKHFTYEQTTPSALWSITHPLNKKVSVTVTDSAGTVMEGQITLNAVSQLEIKFNVPFWGYAYLN